METDPDRQTANPGPPDKSARMLEAQRHADAFAVSGRSDYHALLLYKKALVGILGVEDGFACYRQTIDLPDSDRIRRKSLAGLHEFARNRAAAFRANGPAARHPDEHSLTTAPRTGFVACLIDARVRGKSGLIEMDDAAILEFQGGEPAVSGDRIAADPAVFHAEAGELWTIGPDDEDGTVEFDEGFTLLSPYGGDPQIWQSTLLPRYQAAKASGGLPPVPILVDEQMPDGARQALMSMLPAGGVAIISLPPFVRARVRRLWCAQDAAHTPVDETSGHAATAPGWGLTTHVDRCRLLDSVRRGTAIADRLLGTAIPFDPLPEIAECLRPDALADPDRFYAALMAALFAKNFDVSQGFDDLFASYRGLTGIDGVFDAWAVNAGRYRDIDDDNLAAVAQRRLTVHPIDLFDSFSRRNFVSAKINHGYWEIVACLGLSAAGKPLIREHDSSHLLVGRGWRRSRFDDLLVLAVQRLQTTPGCFVGPGHALGLGLTNGDATFAEDLQLPLHPIVRNALTGMLAFFDGCAAGATVHVADGAAIKNVVFKASLDRLVRGAAERADRVVFIVPPRLAGISLRPPAPPQHIILVPGSHIYELWPTVIAGVAGQLAEIFDRCRRLAIFVQAGAMSVPIGALVHLLLEQQPEHSVHCFDCGQVLDVAIDPSRRPPHTFSLRGTAPEIAGQPIPFVMTAG